MCFAYTAAHTEPDTESYLTFSRQGKCTWWREFGSLNPFGCAALRFRKESINSAQTSGACAGPLVDHVFDEHAGRDELLDIDEAATLAAMVRSRVAHRAPYGQSTKATKVHACFAHVTSTATIKRSDASRFVACIIGAEPAQCRAVVCSLR